MDDYEHCCWIWRSWQRSAPEEIERRLPHYRLMQSYHSVKLEYPTLTFGQVDSLYNRHELKTYTGDIYPTIAVLNHKVAFGLVEACLEERLPLSIDLLCGVQHALTCGLYTADDYVVHENRPGELKQLDSVSSSVDCGSSPEEIEELLQELVDEMPRMFELNDPIVAIAYFHARLMFLKPFSVGNGLVSRMLTDYLLRLNKMPPVVIDGSTSAQYMECLEHFDIREDVEPLVLFLRDQTTAFWLNQMSDREKPATKPKFSLRF